MIRSCLAAPLFALLLLLQPLALRAAPPDTSAAFSGILAGVRFYTLSNGMRVIFYKRDISPVFAGAVVVRVGGTDEPSGQTGISHMLEHMAFKGTAEIGTSDYKTEKVLLAKLEELALAENRAGSLSEAQLQRRAAIQAELSKLWITDQFSREYEKRGASGMNATTDTELTRYFVNLPVSAFEFWCYMESERLLRPVMRQFYQERDVILEERRMRYEDDPSGKLYELLLGTVFRQHPYRNPTIGYAFDVRRLTADMVDQFRRKYYVPGNIVIALVGDLEPETDVKLVERYFGRLAPGPLPERPHAVEPPQEGPRYVKLEERSSPQLTIAYRKPQYPDPDDPPISVMLEILAGSRISPLYTELVKKRQMATGVDSDEGPGVAYPNFMTFNVVPRTPYSSEDVLRVVDAVLARFKRHGAGSAELDRAKRAIAVEYLAGFKSNMSLALQFATSESIYNRWQAPFDWFEKAMAVTEDDIRRVADQYLVERSRSVLQLETAKRSAPRQSGRQ